MGYAADIFPFEAAAHLSAVLSVMEGVTPCRMAVV